MHLERFSFPLQVLAEPGYGKDMRGIQPPKCLPALQTGIEKPVLVFPSRERKISTSSTPASPAKKVSFEPSIEESWGKPPSVHRSLEASPKQLGMVRGICSL